VVAKVTDFGLTGLAPTMAGREVDNPGTFCSLLDLSIVNNELLFFFSFSLAGT